VVRHPNGAIFRLEKDANERDNPGQTGSCGWRRTAARVPAMARREQVSRDLTAA